MKKVLFITNYPSPYRVDFFNLLGKSVDLTVSFTSKPEQQKHRSENWFNTDYKFFKPIFLQKLRKIGGIELYIDIFDIIKNGFDIIIFGGYSSLTFMLAMEYLHKNNIDYYIEADGGLIRKDSRLKHFIKKHFISSATGWFSSGKVTTEYFVFYGAKRDFVFQYPFSSQFTREVKEAGMVLTNWPQAKTDAKNKIGINESKIILSIGQFIPRKGFDLLLHAAAKIDRNVGFYIIGGTPTEEYLDLVQKYQLNNVHFIEFKGKAELQDYYKAADIFVMPTREDIWGLVVNEALSNALPVLTTDKCVAGLELIKNFENGYIVPAEDPDAIADGIIKLLTSDLASMGVKAYLSIKEYTIENMVAAHLKYMDEIIKKGG